MATVKITVEGTTLDECLAALTPSSIHNEVASIAGFEAPVVDASGDSIRMGPVRRALFNTRFLIARSKSVGLRQARAELKQLSDTDVMGVLYTVAASVNKIDAIGDGVLLDKFLAFLSEHWDEILKLILMLIGL